jgi:hypothetical protein
MFPGLTKHQSIIMTKFNPENKESLTYGECLGPVMHITDPEDAKQYKAAYIAFIQKALDKEPSDMTAEQIANNNIGYFAGYGSRETSERVHRLFMCSHPIFGNGYPSAEEALKKGQEAAK